MTDDEVFRQFRSHFPAYGESCYVNHAAISPASTFSREQMLNFWDKRAHFPVDLYEELVALKAEFKKRVRELIKGDSPDEISFTPNTSTALNIVAAGLDWKKGDRILLNTIEFPANVYPFLAQQRHGVEIDYVTPRDGKILLEDIAAQVSSRTRLISISFVQFLNGYKADLATIGRFCRDRDIFFVVDGIQGVGISPIDVNECRIDALAVGGQKWLMWPMGAGFLYLREAVRERVYPVFAGWLSVKDNWNFFDYNLDFQDSGERFEGGTSNWMALWLAADMLRRFLELRPERIQQKIERLTNRLLEKLDNLPLEVVTPRDSAERAGIVSVRVKNAEKTIEKMRKNRIIASLREGIVRFSPHCTNTEEEIDFICQVLEKNLGY